MKTSKISFKLLIALGIGFVLINLLISFVATKTIPYLGYFSYPEMLDLWDIPLFLKRFAGFDGLHYIKIATEGYARNATAFLPVYPLLMRAGITLTHLAPPIVGIGISVGFLMAILFFLPRYLSLFQFSKSQIIWFLAFFLAFPTSFFFQSVYTESVFVASLLLALYFGKQKKYWLSALFGFLTGLSRITGFFLSIVFFIESCSGIFSKNGIKHVLLSYIKSLSPSKILWLVSPLLGFMTFMGFLYATTGDPLRFAHSQVDFNQNRTLGMVLPPQVVWRYLKIFATASWNFQYFVALVEFVLTAGTVIVLTLDAVRIWSNKNKSPHTLTRAGLNAFSWASILLPIGTGTLLSMPRFILPLFPVFMTLSEIPQPWVKRTVLTVFILFHIVLLMAFIQGYYVA